MAGRVLVLVLGAASLAVAVARSSDRDRLAAAERYRCPMHPEVASQSPSACPICGMALERVHVSAAADPEDAPDRARVVAAVRRVFREDVRAPAWVDASGAVTAMLYRDDLVGFPPDSIARFSRFSAPPQEVEVRLTSGPVTDWDSSTASARFEAAGDAALRPGDHGSLLIAARPRELLVVPISAVVSCPAGPCVLVRDPASQQLVRRTVQVGRTRQGFTAILSGISEGDQVAAGNAFFLDAERSSMLEVVP